MKLVINHPELAPALVSALAEANCVARRLASDTIEVLVPWPLDRTTRAHAATELMFFVRAWAGDHPTFRATLVEAG
jgi:hypothetical protein